MSSNKILVLGSGAVARPCVEYLTRNASNILTVACRTLSTATALASGLPRMRAISLDVSSSSQLEYEVAAHDLVISLVPFVYHTAVIKAAISGRTNVVTASYVSPAIRELESSIQQAGITVLNEVGVDPGIDHLYAVKTIDEVHAKGGKIKKFYSFCGGIPAPECADNPLGFKFSWSPRGALLSQQNSATFIQDGKVVNIPAEDLMSTAEPYFVTEGYDFVAYANRDSVPFREFYRIPEAETVIRGSLRYAGNPAFIHALIQLGWLDQGVKDWLKAGLTWAQVQQKAINAKEPTESSIISRIKEICKFSSEAESERIISGLRWFRLFSDEPADIKGGTLLDTLANQLDKLLSYKPGERDLVVLQHKFVVEWKDGKTDTLTSTLELLGDPQGYSGMAKSVGVTCGVATQLLLDGLPSLNIPGIIAPYSKEICDPIREIVEQEGIKLVEKVL